MWGLVEGGGKRARWPTCYPLTVDRISERIRELRGSGRSPGPHNLEPCRPSRLHYHEHFSIGLHSEL